MRLGRVIQKQIQEDAVARVKRLGKQERTNLYLHSETLQTGRILRAAALEVPIRRETALVFVDHAPEFNWAHPCEYHLYDAQTGKLYQKVPASLPPAGLAEEAHAVIAFHRPVKVGAGGRVGAPGKRLAVLSNAMSNATGRRFAILYSGLTEARHLNDLEFLYRTLINVYGFDAADIRVCNHDSSVNYFLSTTYGPSTSTIGTSLGKWPGDNTAYSIVVNHAGTRAGLQDALNDIAGQIRPEDLLFIHTNNHGGGPCDTGVNDYCLFEYDSNVSWNPYYVSDFITDLGTLPQFQVLEVMMEQCRSGGFTQSIIDNSPATWTHVATAVTADDYSLAWWQGYGTFDPFARDWIAGIAGNNPGGGVLAQTVDTNADGRISAAEAFAYADAQHKYKGTVLRTCTNPDGVTSRNLCLGDTPTSAESPAGYGAYVFLGLPAHDLYLRDNLQDTGREPLIGGGISCSPDIVVFNQELLDPDTELGSPVAQRSDTLGEPVEAGQDNFIYLRVQNRGTQPTGGTARLFWAEPSVLPTPLSWHEITAQGNPFPIPTVNPQEMEIVGPILWSQNDIPGPGHYCFVGLINSGDDPAPDPDTIHTIDDYNNFIRQSNNATWRNFDVQDLFQNSIAHMDFKIQGWPRVKLWADLVFDLSALPSNFKLKLRIPTRLGKAALLENARRIRRTERYQWFELMAGTHASLCHIKLKSSDACEAALDIAVPAKTPDGDYRLSAAEVVDGKEMGRVTRMLSVKAYPYMGNRRTHELHIANCEWASKTSPRNREAYENLERAFQHGYDGCRFCLPEYSRD